MRVVMRPLGILGILTCIAAAGATAQGPHRRQGFWAGFGIGYGSANTSCDDCTSGPRVGGYTAWLKAGGTLNPSVRLGVLADGWSHISSGVTETMGNLTASVFLYPRASSGFFLTGGAGFSDYRLDTSPSITGTGWGFTVGLGYDLRIGGELSLTPVANYGWGGVGDLSYGDGGGFYTTGWKQNYLDFSLGLTFH